jgi:putative alpha-1,2-mannosidase
MITGQFALHSRIESITKATIANDRDMICFIYSSDAVEVHVRMATSLISSAQAMVSLDREIDPVELIYSITLIVRHDI